MAIPLALFGVARAVVAFGALSPVNIVTLYWNLVGAGVGLGLAYALINASRREPTAHEIARATSLRGYAPAGCYTILGGGVLVIGVGMILSATSRMAAATTAGAIGAVTVPTVVTLVGAWLVVAGRVTAQRDGPLLDALLRNDPEPWRYAERWAGGQARPLPRWNGGFPFGLALAWNAMCWPTALAIVSSGDTATRFLVLIPAAAGLWWARAAIRSPREGRSGAETVLTMETFPAAVGGRLAGVVETAVTPKVGPGSVFTVSLRCVRQKQDSFELYRQPRELLWAAHATIPAVVPRGARRNTVALRVDFPLPADVRPTTLHDALDRIVWYLHIDGSGAAAAFAVEMEVPVFDLRSDAERAAAAPTVEQIDADVRSAMARPVRDAAAEPLPEGRAPRSLLGRLFPEPSARFSIEDRDGGVVRVHSETGDRRRARVGLLMAAIGVLWVVAVGTFPEAQWLAGTGVMPIAAVFAGMYLWGARYRYSKVDIELRSTDLTVRSRTVAAGEAIVPYRALASAEVREGTERSVSIGREVLHRVVEHDVILLQSAGQAIPLGLRLTNRPQAEWLASVIGQSIDRTRAPTV